MALFFSAVSIVMLYRVSWAGTPAGELDALGAFKGSIELMARSAHGTNASLMDVQAGLKCTHLLEGLRNPVFELAQQLVRDPAIIARTLPGQENAAGGRTEWSMYFTLFTGEPRKMWSDPTNYTVSVVRTTDWHMFSKTQAVTPTGFVSPDSPTEWRGSTLLAFQAYPDRALGGPVSGLFVSWRLSAPGELERWGSPRPFLQEALDLPWNTVKRTIDPTLVVGPDDKLHCFFVGSQWVRGNKGKQQKANLLGHAVTDDPELRQWDVLTRDRPLLGVSERALDGVENVAVFTRRDGQFQMIYSEGLAAQHLAYAVSEDLYTWHDRGPLLLGGTPSEHDWLAGRYGAPYVWREPSGCFMMALMGEYSMKLAYHRSAIGLLTSADGEKWQLLRARKISRAALNVAGRVKKRES